MLSVEAIHPIKYMRDFLSRKIRPDGRNLMEARPTAINVSSLNTSDGSALVKIGNTVVMCGIKAELTQPIAEEPDKGFIIPNVELPPLCSPVFKSGPPGEQAQVCNQFMAEIIENSGCIDLKQLCIAPDKLAWVLYCDMICLDYDGSVLDACVASLVAALKTVKLPEVKYDVISKTTVVSEKKKKSLEIKNVPISSTFATFDEDILLADPTREEESLSEGSVTVATAGDELCCVHKPGGCRLTEQQLQECIRQAHKRAQLMRGMVNASIKTLT